jgi:Ca2+/Na+ antiporter
MAGATLLAFSNGATDVITTLVASGNSDSDDLAVGALFGASTFAVTIILATVIWARPGNVIKDLKRGNLVRDIITYLIAVATFVISGFYSTSYWIIGTILILIYFVYVFIVWLEERNKVSTIGQGKRLENVIRNTIAAHGQTTNSPLEETLKSVLTGPEYNDRYSTQPEIKINIVAPESEFDSIAPSRQTTGTEGDTLGSSLQASQPTGLKLVEKPSD